MESDAELDTRKLVSEQNRKKKKSGGFQSMGLSQAIFKGIIKKGYKVPTPIQRKCIPIIMEGGDVVAMARTGSGKTAAFLIPMFEKLQKRSAKTGARGLIFSPTRELALQTYKFTKELGKFTGLKSALILGGDKMEDQFASIHENPDVIIATPGRFLHVVMEMDLKLSSVEYVVFDEADRLFEMGFAEQLRETLNRLPDNRQTLLFSATLPRILADFAKAGLNDPSLIRLDVDTKLSDQLKLAFISCRSEDKLAVLLHLLTSVIQPNQLTVVFAPTKHHVEYIHMVLAQAGLKSTYMYSNLDPAARKINIAKLQSRQVDVLIVTDLAARGIDIPLLDNVINYSFPPKSKLFVHRVGRVARAGRNGIAYSIISPDEAPFVLDLHLFLGRPMKYCVPGKEPIGDDGYYGTVPRNIVEDEEERLEMWHNMLLELASMKKVCSNAYKQFLKSRPNPSSESVRRMKDELHLNNLGSHPVYGDAAIQENEAITLLQQMKAYKPNSTIFEINATAKTPASAVMRQMRKQYSKAVTLHHMKVEEKLAEQYNPVTPETSTENTGENEDVEGMFSTVMKPKKSKSEKPFQPRKRKKEPKPVKKDEEYYIPYKASNHYSERGLEVEKGNFGQEAAGAILDFTGDDVDVMKKHKTHIKWDRKKKKFVNESGKESTKKRIKTESGAWIPATYKSDIYKKWKHKQKVDEQNQDDDDEANENAEKTQNFKKAGGFRKNKLKPAGGKGLPYKRELKRKEEILKERKRKKHVQFHQKRRQLEKSKRKPSQSKTKR